MIFLAFLSLLNKLKLHYVAGDLHSKNAICSLFLYGHMSLHTTLGNKKQQKTPPGTIFRSPTSIQIFAPKSKQTLHLLSAQNDRAFSTLTEIAGDAMQTVQVTLFDLHGNNFVARFSLALILVILAAASFVFQFKRILATPTSKYQVLLPGALYTYLCTVLYLYHGRKSAIYGVGVRG